LRINRLCGWCVLAMLPALSGCLVHHRTVLRVDMAQGVQSASVDQLVTSVNTLYDGVNSMNATVTIAASVGGGATGNETDYDPLSGYILMRKPADMRVLMLVPVLHTRAIDMVSDGTNFKMLIPPKNRAIEGTETVTTPSKNPLENLRPHIFLESLLPRGVSKDELVSLTSDTQIQMSDKGKHATAIPDYDLNILRPKGNSNELETLRVIHINRVTLLPYQQDIYDEQGRLATQAMYDQYQDFGGLKFPTSMTIRRPLDDLQIKLTVQKLTVNQKMEDDQFELKIPANTTIQKME